MYEQLWTIPDWDRIQRSRRLISVQTFEFETCKSTGVQTKWRAGFKFNNLAKFHLYLKLIETKGFPDNRVRASTNRSILKDDSSIPLCETPKDVIRLAEDIAAAATGTLCFNSERWVSESWVNSNGEVTFKIKLTIMEPEIPETDLHTEQFHKASFAQVRTNFASLLGNQSTADLKIITSDEKEMFAHKTILRGKDYEICWLLQMIDNL